MNSHFQKTLLLVLLLAGRVYSGDDPDSTPTTLVFPSFLHTMGIRKATKSHLMLYTRNKVKVRNPQGIAVVRLESWDDPKETKDDDEVTGYGINSGSNMIVYNKSMSALGFYGNNKKGKYGLKRPTAVAANERGDVYVADTGNHRLVRFYNPKRSLKFSGAIGGKGAAPGLFDSPRGVALDFYGMVYISDTNNHRIQVLRPDDQLHHWFGRQGIAEGELWHPTGIAVTNGKEKWSYYHDAFIVVIDLDGTRVQKFSLEGQPLGAIHLTDFGFTKGLMGYLAIDYYSQIWVTDFENHSLHKFDRNLKYLTSFGSKGDGDREFQEPRGITIYKRFGQVFIAEKESAQYYWIGTDMLELRSEYLAEAGLVAFRFFLTEPSFLSIKINNTMTGADSLLFERSQYFPGERVIYFDGNWKRVHPRPGENFETATGIKQKFNRASFGRYEFRIKIEATYSSYKYFAKELNTEIIIN